MAKFNKQLRKLRQSAKLTQKDAAKSFGISPRTWEAWESGRHQPAEIVRNLLVFKLANRSVKIS